MPGIQNSKSTLDFLGTIGSQDRGDGVTMNNTAKALVRLADFLIDHAANSLQSKGHVASGDTISSMTAGPIEVDGTKMFLDIEILKTYKFLDLGVKGYVSGKGKYQFKKPGWGKGKRTGKGKVSPMVLAILKWMRKRSISSKYKAISKNEKKNQRIKKMVSSADSLKSLAYAVATNIKKKGIKPTYFFTKAVTATKAQSRKEFASAIKLDIIESLNPN